MSKLITAIFKNRSSAMLASEDLCNHGFPQDDISLLMSETTKGREFKIAERTKSPEGLSLGAAIGGVLGLVILGFNSAGMIAFPGVYFAGEGIPMIVGFGVGALIGGIIGGIIGLAIPEHEAELSKSETGPGGILLGVCCPNDQRAQEAHKLLEANYAQCIRMEDFRDANKLRRAS